ncbi:hypothetical protein diail_9553 [Diaporthe ilicicola]|nr:hypothetical protein diail_9553 [Diaporthe ilicicola]
MHVISSSLSLPHPSNITTHHGASSKCSSSMASTPASSFRSDDFPIRGRATRRKEVSPSTLPSPESETDCLDAAIEQAYKTIWALFCGTWPQAPASNPTFQLQNQQSYDRLYEKLAEHKGLLGYYEDEIRRDWDSDTCTLTLQLMACPVHEFFKESIARAIDKELDRIAELHPSLRPFRHRLGTGGNTSVQKRRRGSQSAPVFDKSPDSQWHYQNVRYPPVVLEVAYSQDEENLDDKVIQFFKHLPGGVCTVLGFKITYISRAGRKTGIHSASLSVWTSTQEDSVLDVQHTIDSKVFRDLHGSATPGELVLPFEWFLPIRERKNLPSDLGAEIRLSFAHLCELLDDAEQRQRTIEASVSPSLPGSPGSPKRTVKRIRFRDEHGAVIGSEQVSPESKRRKASVNDLNDGLQVSARTRSRTRSLSQHRSSERLRSRSQGAHKTYGPNG